MRPHGPWQIVQSELIYRDPWLSLQKDEVIRPDGKAGTHSVVHLKPGVCVLAVNAALEVVLTEEFHYGVGRVTLEAVSGGIEADEMPLIAAQRELQEELGIRADRWDDLGTVDPFTASVVSPTQLYLARELTLGNAAPEGTEQIRSVTMSLEQAVKRVFSGEITHAPSCVVLLKSAWILGGYPPT